MKPDIKAQWVAALRSGEYEQGKGVLREIDNDGTLGGYCCLGVLCDLAVKAGVIPEPTIKTYDHGPKEVLYDEADAILPSSVAEWAGLIEPDEADSRPICAPIVTLPKAHSVAEFFLLGDEDDAKEVELTGLNDETDLGFAGIADLIEASL